MGNLFLGGKKLSLSIYAAGQAKIQKDGYTRFIDMEPNDHNPNIWVII